MSINESNVQWPTWGQLYRMESLWKPIGWSKHVTTRLRSTIAFVASDPTTASCPVAVAVKDWGNGPGNGPDGIEELRLRVMPYERRRLGLHAVSRLLALVDEWQRQQGQTAK